MTYINPQQVMSGGTYLLGYVQNVSAILKSAILDQNLFYLPKGGWSCTMSKNRIVSEINCSSQICDISCGSIVINTECCNNNREQCL